MASQKNNEPSCEPMIGSISKGLCPYANANSQPLKHRQGKWISNADCCMVELFGPALGTEGITLGILPEDEGTAKCIVK